MIRLFYSHSGSLILYMWICLVCKKESWCIVCMWFDAFLPLLLLRCFAFLIESMVFSMCVLYIMLNTYVSHFWIFYPFYTSIYMYGYTLNLYKQRRLRRLDTWFFALERRWWMEYKIVAYIRIRYDVSNIQRDLFSYWITSWLYSSPSTFTNTYNHPHIKKCYVLSCSAIADTNTQLVQCYFF